MYRFYRRRQKLPYRFYRRRQKLPEEMVEEILLRLPTKEVGRLRLLSKAWNSHLSSPRFVKAHSKFHMNRGEPEFIISNSSYDYEYLFIFPGRDDSAKLVSSPLFGRGYPSVEASCYGFVVVEIKFQGVEEKRMLLFNPTTEDAIEIPPFKSLIPKESSYFLGLGYDSSSDDYKVLRLSKSSEFYGTFVDIYSFKTKTWKNLGESPYLVHDATHGDGVFINGCLHWLASDKDNQDNQGRIIVAFDLANEEFKEVPSPIVTCDDSKECSNDSSEESLDDNTEEDSEGGCDDDSEEDDGSEDFDDSFKGFDWDSEVIVFEGGCLGVMNNPEDKNCIEIWVMREYGVQESWKKLLIPIYRGVSWRDGYVYDDASIIRFICLSGKDKLIFMEYSAADNGFPFLEYSLSTGKCKDVIVRGENDDIEIEPNARVVTFRECLLPPNLLGLEE